MKNILTIPAVILVLTSSNLSHGSIRPVTISVGMELKAPRWMHEPSEVTKIKGLQKDLYLARKYYLKGSWDNCLRFVEKGWAKAPSLRPWLLLEKLKCAQGLLGSNSKKRAALTQAILQLDRKPSWVAMGPYSESLRAQSVSAHLDLLSVRINSDRRKAWDLVNRLIQMKMWMSSDQLASVYRYASELAFLQQKLSVAREYLVLSLTEKESRELRRKLKSLNEQLKVVEDDKAIVPEIKEVFYDESMVGSEDEKKLFARMERTYSVGDWISAVEDGISLIEKYPQSRRSIEANRIIRSVFRKIVISNGKKWILVKKRVVNLMKRADGERLHEWAESAFGWGRYEEAYELSRQSMEKLEGLGLAPEAMLLAARSANTTGKYSEARNIYNELLLKYSGTNEAIEGRFRLGLLEYRLKEYTQAISLFERLLSITTKSDFDLESRYWLWRSLQAINSDQAKERGEELISRYPLTYYGLRALSEIRGLDNFLSAKKNEAGGGKESLSFASTLYLSESDNQTWERFLVLLGAGWFGEAQAELALLPLKGSAKTLLVQSYLASKAFDHFKGISLAQKAWDENQSLLTKETVHLAFPREYKTLVKSWSQKNNIDEYKIHALIKQESSYRESVQSPSAAFGLMQILVPTGRDIGRKIGYSGEINSEVLKDPNLNVRFGVYYLKRLMGAYGGNYPLSLAAYNVGIGNMRKWMGARSEFDNLSKLDSSPQNEIWMDELAWDETSHYVKAVMRNYIIYQILYRPSENKLSDKTWEPLNPKITF